MSAGGCFDKLVAAEYEDCFLSTQVLSSDLLEWLHDSITGANAFQNVTLVQLSDVGSELSRTSITHAFMRDFSVSDFDTTSNTVVLLSFVLVPGSLQNAGTSTSSAATTPVMRTAFFSVDIPNVDHSRITQVHGLHVSFGKNLVTPQVGLRHQFVPGVPQFDDISIEMLVGGGTTAANFDAWAQNISNGQTDTRTGVLHALDQGGQLVQDITLSDLSPVAFPAFTTSDGRRTITLSLVRFDFQ